MTHEWRGAATREPSFADWLRRLFGPPLADAPARLRPRWIFLRGLGLIFLSAFYSLAFQIHGLIGERGILPAGGYLYELARALPGVQRFWLAPTLLWIDASDAALTAVVAAGALCSILLAANVWPRLTAGLCTLFFMSCVGALQDFSSYQSDGMLLEAGFLSIFFAPRGVRPGLGAHDPPSRASLFLLQWEWFRIYFESGAAKLLSGDPHWRDFTAMDEYYQNGPLPTWIGWYVQHLPHAYHAATAFLTLLIELVVVLALFMPRHFRLVCFLAVSALQVGIIATANYTFLNYLVLLLGVLLVDDRFLASFGVRRRRRTAAPSETATEPTAGVARAAGEAAAGTRARAAPPPAPGWRTWVSAAALIAVFYATIAPVVFRRGPATFLVPAEVLGSLRVANQYGLFAVMTEARYEVEFQGTRDGRTWLVYKFRYKPQDPFEAPGIYAPYQPRFDWNLWFASLGPWSQSQWVVLAQQRLLENSPSVLGLFAGNPFPGAPPTQVRTVLWQYWFTDMHTKRRTGAWWRRELRGPFTGTLLREPDGRMRLVGSP
jgi:lipase maturation factor 1